MTALEAIVREWSAKAESAQRDADKSREDEHRFSSGYYTGKAQAYREAVKTLTELLRNYTVIKM